MKDRNADAKNILKSSGLRLTRQRTTVLSTLLRSPNTPMSVDETTAHLPEGFDRVTAYRILNCFAEKGLLEKITHVSNDLKFIVSPNIRKQHEHLVTCRVCGITWTAKICVQPGWRQEILKLGFKNISHNLSFSGVCGEHA